MTSANKHTKQEKQLIIDWLIEHFPKTFFRKSSQIKPLQLGIFDDIIEFYERLEFPDFSKKSLREAINYYSSSPAYLKCQKTAAARVDIYGNEVDKVSEEQADYAAKRYQERYPEKKPTKSPAAPTQAASDPDMP